MKPMNYRARKQFSRRAVLTFVAIFVLLYLSSSSSSPKVGNHVADKDAVDDPFRMHYEFGLYPASTFSPFSYINTRITKLKEEKDDPKKAGKKTRTESEEDKILLNWNKGSRFDQCRLLVKGFYTDEKWNNMNLVYAWSSKDYMEKTAQFAGECMRIYNYCFFEGDVNPRELFKKLDLQATDAYDFQKRMFFFLKNVTQEDSDYLYPTIKNVRTGEVVSKPKTKQSPQEFNSNFFANWRKIASGRGIVLSAKPDDIDMLRQQLSVWKELGNKYPIQVVHKGGELTRDNEISLKQFAEETDQNIYIVDAGPVLDKNFADEHITKFHNKWVGVLFNTFEEYIMVDADTVPFISAEDFFESENFKKSGMRMWRDRTLTNRHIREHCPDLALKLEPSLEEHRILGTTLRFKLLDPDLKQEKTSEERAFNQMRTNLALHHVDSGLVVINKKEKLHSLLLSEFFQNHALFRRCSYGDKELFWYAAFSANTDYVIEPEDAATIGKLEYSEKDRRYSICAIQMAHTDSNDQLLWTNTGLRNCKIPEVAKKDFDENPKMMTEKYGSLEVMKISYHAPLQIDGYLIPDPEEHEWQQTHVCADYTYCGFVDELNIGYSKAKVHEFSDEEKKRLNKISKIWNNADVNKERNRIGV